MEWAHFPNLKQSQFVIVWPRTADLSRLLSRSTRMAEYGCLHTVTCMTFHPNTTRWWKHMIQKMIFNTFGIIETVHLICSTEWWKLDHKLSRQLTELHSNTAMKQLFYVGHKSFIAEIQSPLATSVLISRFDIRNNQRLYLFGWRHTLPVHNWDPRQSLWFRRSTKRNFSDGAGNLERH